MPLAILDHPPLARRPAESKAEATRLKYRPAIDGIRTLAVLSVFTFHLNHEWLPGGFVGVDVFFVISGFLITSLIYSDCLSGRFSLVQFYQRRIARIFPAFLTVAAVTLLAASGVYSPQDLATAAGNFAAAALSAANLKLMLQGNYFAVLPDAHPFLHYWSLSVEEQFYMIFPVVIFFLHKFARRALLPSIGMAMALSFAGCVWLTQLKPIWAFYLLPTRGWELLAGGWLAIVAGSRSTAPESSLWRAFSMLGLALILGSFLLIHEDAGFPGWIAALPVLGSLMLIGPNSGSSGAAERWLAHPALVYLGKRSYSLYLWHWPVFTLVDYGLFMSPEWQRLLAKLFLSFTAAFVSYEYVEAPCRRYLNDRSRRTLAFAGVLVASCAFVAAGLLVRSSFYIGASETTAAKGGRVFAPAHAQGSIVLLGDSTASMYGTALKQMADELDFKLTVLSVAAKTPLPSTNGIHGNLWIHSFTTVTNTRPDVVILACKWHEKLSYSKERLPLAIDYLSPYTRKIVLIAMPPVLPSNASRKAIREGATPPFLEHPETRAKREHMNAYVKSLQSGKVVVLDPDPLLKNSDGGIRFLDESGHQLYHDPGHLSHYGAKLIIPLLRQVLTGRKEDLQRSAASPGFAPPGAF